MIMKVMTSKEAQNAFGTYMDTAQREPVVVTKRNRPVVLTVSMENLSSIFEIADAMRGKIRAGVKAGLEDTKAGRGEVLNDEFVDKFNKELEMRLVSKK